MIVRPWTKMSHINFRVEVESNSHNRRAYKDDEKYLDAIAGDLNDMFSDHHKCPFSAFVNYDEVSVCRFCKVPYEEIIDEDSHEPVCAACGKGAKEAMLERLGVDNA